VSNAEAAATGPTPARSNLAVIAGLACALRHCKALPSTDDAISRSSNRSAPSSDPPFDADTVEPISFASSLPNVPRKRVTIVRVFYGPALLPGRTGMPAPSPPISPRGNPLPVGAAARSELQSPVLLRAARRDASGLGNASNTEPAS